MSDININAPGSDIVMNGRKKLITNLALLAFTLVILVAYSEALLRSYGLQPFKKAPSDGGPAIFEYDPVLGWRNKEGTFRLPSPSHSGGFIDVTNDADGSRSTGAGPEDGRCEVVLVGGSFTQGFALSDSETLGWKLQSMNRGYTFKNFGTGGYGTYQSLLTLEREWPRLTCPRLVLYGFNDYHELRNIAHPEWLAALESTSSRGHVYVPYATLDKDGRLVRHDAVGYPRLPFQEHSALITMMQKYLMRVSARDRTSQDRAVTKALMLDMASTVKSHGADFIVVILNVSDADNNEYAKFLEASNVEYIDCSGKWTKDLLVPGDGHPNGKLNSIWAQCISGRLKEYL